MLCVFCLRLCSFFLLSLPSAPVRPNLRALTPGPARGGAQVDLQQPLPTVEEQGLCIGATFGIKAYNGRDGGRRINVLGFCRSVEMLHDHVAAALHIRGGEIVAHEYKSEGLHENLKLTVALPYLWGVPPELDSLNTAIKDGESTGRAAGSRPRD